MAYTTPLCPLMDKYGSDKGPRTGNTTHHTYTEVYHQLFKEIVDKKLNVFELGLGTNNPMFLCNMGVNGRPGASLRAWRDYFKQSMVYGADIDKGCLFQEERITTMYCDQLNSQVIRSMWSTLPMMDIIIDDGVHTFEANVTFFENSIHKLNQSGVFIIEDISHNDINRFKNKIAEWKRVYPSRSFSLRVLSGGNPYDNNMLIVKSCTISVCIPTMKRFSFLKNSIPKYLDNPHVSELIITDETGEDYAEITAAFSHPKLKVYQNETRLGMLKNKLRSGSYATSDFVAILDSDNFADLQYFEAFKTFIETRDVPFASVFMPSIAKPNFDYRQWIDIPVHRKNIKQLYPAIDTCLNTMNLIVPRSFLSTIDILTDKPLCDEIGCYDSQYFSLYVLFHMNGTMFIVRNMEYEHAVHPESGWLTTHTQYENAHSLAVNRYLSSEHLSYRMTLSEWQQTYKRYRDLILQASSSNEDDGWMPFPIGMNYTYPAQASKGELLQFGTHSNTVLCAINPNTDRVRRPSGKNRLSILTTLHVNGISNNQVSPSEFYESLPSYKFVISPEGNGIDCHRHYEALIAGCIPIVERNPLIEQKYKGCPILFTDDYSEITCEYLDAKYEEMKNNVYDFSVLYLSYYSTEVQAEIKRCGNYWMVRHTGQPVYV